MGKGAGDDGASKWQNGSSSGSKERNTERGYREGVLDCEEGGASTAEQRPPTGDFIPS